MTAIEASDVTAVILAGGQGKRVGGKDKGLLDFRGKPLISHVIDAVASQVPTILISANRNRDDYAAFGYPIIEDRKAGFCGPLAGIDAALNAMQTPYLLCVPCDTPLLPADLVSVLYEALQASTASIAVASDGDRIHPVISIMRGNVINSVAERLQAGEYKLMDWLESESYVTVDFSDRPIVLSNLNTIAEIEGLM